MLKLKLLKKILLPLYLVLFVLVLQINFPKQSAAIIDFFYIKKIFIDNGESSNLSYRYIEKYLPENKSIFYWFFNKNNIQKKILEDPLFANAQIYRCGFFSINCYRFRYESKTPKFIFKISQVFWLADINGVLLRPIDFNIRKKVSGRVKSEKKYLSSQEIINLKILKKFTNNLLQVEFISKTEKFSPTTLEARMKLFVQAFKYIKLNKLLKLKKIYFTSSGDMVFAFKKYNFKAIFKVPSVLNLGAFSEQLERLNYLVLDLEEKLNSIKTIDLAFDRQVVVKFKKAKAKESSSYTQNKKIRIL